MQRRLAVSDSVGARFVCIGVFCPTVAHRSISSLGVLAVIEGERRRVGVVQGSRGVNAAGPDRAKPTCGKPPQAQKNPAGAAHLRGHRPEDACSSTLFILTRKLSPSMRD